ncbi:MAG: hypothetical protein IPM42_05295 [Saprospiraceae bacterium]|nr:hypothetical protein [Saprospiraceae bacterium]
MFFILLFSSFSLFAQEDDDLLSLLGEEKTTDYVNASFKTNRVVNLHSLENTAAGVFDFKISHRFNSVRNGIYDLFGLDGATIRFGGDYGISDVITVGGGRSTIDKSYDAYLKYKFLRQSTGEKNMPFSAAMFASAAVNTTKWADPDRDNFFSSRLFYTYQLILGRKFNESFTLQVSPTLVHRNLVRTNQEKHDVYAIAGAGRIKLTKRVALNAEYIYVLPDQLGPEFTNSVSIGFDIETGGHVFQLHFTNSRSMIEKGFITETTGNWMDGDIHFGFNISRVFTVKKKKID